MIAVQVVGRVGDDAAGDQVLLALVAAGVRLRTNVAKRARVRENALFLVFRIVQRLGQTGGP